jgi:ABC-type transport system substrate-binding protein
MSSSYNPVFGPLVEQATGTADAAKLASAYQAIQRELNKNSPWFPLFQPAGAIAYSSNLSGVALSPLNLINVATVASK